jgi:hypothetical protein
MACLLVCGSVFGNRVPKYNPRVQGAGHYFNSQPLCLVLFPGEVIAALFADMSSQNTHYGYSCFKKTERIYSFRPLNQSKKFTEDEIITPNLQDPDSFLLLTFTAGNAEI